MTDTVTPLPWSTNERRQFHVTARQVFDNPDVHPRLCRSWKPWERASCSGCVLRGYHVRDGKGSFRRDEGGPDYAGWARIYVEAGIPIPLIWKAAFARERASDNRRYAEALERSIVTFGVTFLPLD